MEDLMPKARKALEAASGAAQSLELLQQLQDRYKDFIKDNSDLQADLWRFERCLEAVYEGKLWGSAGKCRDAFEKILLRLEEIAEDQQRLYDESLTAPPSEAVPESTRDFEIKKSFEKLLPLLP
jgi:hypothetical protein